MVRRGASIEAFTFFIPYPADALADEFRADGQQPPNFTVSGVETIISISVLHSGSIIYYDQWEDGLEPNLTMPVQATTQVWGDNNPSNGSPPGIASDVLQSGDIIVLKNVVPVPRNPADLFFDGGDQFVSVGGALAVTLGVWPQPDAGILFGAAWEIYPTSRWDPNYVIPVGQDVPRPGGSFTTVGLNVQAVQDGTTVQLDMNADGTLIDPSGGVVTPGQVITFDLTITNTGNVTITALPLTDTFDANYLTFRSASVPPDVPGEVAWTDLTSVLGDLPPMTTLNVSVSFDVADNIPSDVVSTTNVVLGEGVQDSSGRSQAIVCGAARVSFATPIPTSTPTPTPTSTPTPKPKRTSEPTATPHPAATPTPLPLPSPAPSPTSAVIFLPETGVGYVRTRPLWPLVTLPGLGFLVGWVIYRRLRK